MDWSAIDGWHDPKVGPLHNLSLHPAAAVLHYSQAIFEGLKAYRRPDGSVQLFRPDAHELRFQASARRLRLPELPTGAFVDSLSEFLQADASCVPEPPASLYLRPFLVGTEPFLGVRAADAAQFHIIASPVDHYFAGAPATLDIWLTQRYSRAGRGGTGAAKTGGSYASSLIALQEAQAHGCQQALFLDAAEGRYIEELGGMNLVLVGADGTVIAPSSDSILAGVTVDSLLTLAEARGHRVERRPVELAEWASRAEDGSIVAAFACGTAAVVAPIGVLRGEEIELRHRAHPLADLPHSLGQQLLEIQYGRGEDVHGWLVPLHATTAATPNPDAA